MTTQYGRYLYIFAHLINGRLLILYLNETFFIQSTILPSSEKKTVEPNCCFVIENHVKNLVIQNSFNLNHVVYCSNRKLFRPFFCICAKRRYIVVAMYVCMFVNTGICTSRYRTPGIEIDF